MSVDEQRWKAVVARDAHADGEFVYGVVSTGVFCHPSCPSRPARRGNVRFFDGSDAALAAGFRACRRCLPDQGTPLSRRAARIEMACRLLGGSERMTVSDVATRLGIGRHALSREFQAVIGLTPKQWQLSQCRERVVDCAQSSARVSDAMFDAGYESATRFYQDVRDRLGMKPSDIRDGARGEQIRYTLASSPLGRLLVAWTDRGLCAVELSPAGEHAADNASVDERASDDRLEQALQGRFSRASLHRDDDAGAALVQAVVARIAEPDDARLLPLDLRGTAFQQRVWTALLNIPVGETRTYSELASRLGSPRSSRAVANACAANPVAIVVPCHRVIRADGSVSGYRWGDEHKQFLLKLEQRSTSADEIRDA